MTYDLDTDRVTYDLDTTTHKIIEVVGSPLYLATPVSTALLKSHLSLVTVVENVFMLTLHVLTQTAEFFFNFSVSNIPMLFKFLM